MADNIHLEGLAEFSSGLKEDLKEVRVAGNTVARRLAADIVDRLVKASPVDTGRFRSNWFVGVDAVPDETGDVFDEQGAPSKARARAVLGTLPDSFRTIEIVNNLPYGMRLNDGYSRQAPKGFVEAAVDTAMATLS